MLIMIFSFIIVAYQFRPMISELMRNHLMSEISQCLCSFHACIKRLKHFKQDQSNTVHITLENRTQASCKLDNSYPNTTIRFINV